MTLTTFALPPGFVYLDEIDPSIIQEIGSGTSKNITGKPLPGYKCARCIVTRPTALALAQAQKIAKNCGFSLKVFEGYQPKQAVEHLIHWSKDPEASIMKSLYYPKVQKADVAKWYDSINQNQSAHSRGSTVAVTLVAVSSKGAPLHEVDMGTAYYNVDSKTNFSCREFNSPKNEDSSIILSRLLLELVMWQSTLDIEPFPETHFDFPVA